MAWCVERPFHPKQRVSRETDAAGRPQLRLVVDRCDEEEIASRLLRLGGAFTVVSPPSLVDKIKAAARRVVERHENGT
jgi:predicted DNA-binding transcriptional regulator YafY